MDPNTSIDSSRVTAFADKLGIEFALIHRKRKGKCLSSPESMEILVGDVKDKVNFSTTFITARTHYFLRAIFPFL